ncbi:hypothetical protein RvY_02847 [Ramazzottius varieornatus]|uniref:Uncharacterized protein n=1 Tax=Ramazzottius varieornatus TaxID=947166 RepID=A0A1D1ULW4_RAMVA|nr:hypothetical protein RvY_02847 [Ramazzottius varieornatus]
MLERSKSSDEDADNNASNDRQRLTSKPKKTRRSLDVQFKKRLSCESRSARQSSSAVLTAEKPKSRRKQNVNAAPAKTRVRGRVRKAITHNSEVSLKKSR